MEEIEATWREAVIVWWAYVWRSIVFIFPTAFVLGFLSAVLVQTSGVSVESNQLWIQLMGPVIGTVMSIWILKNLLNKKFGKFRIALLKLHTEHA